MENNLINGKTIEKIKEDLIIAKKFTIKDLEKGKELIDEIISQLNNDVYSIDFAMDLSSVGQRLVDECWYVSGIKNVIGDKLKWIKQE